MSSRRRATLVAWGWVGILLGVLAAASPVQAQPGTAAMSFVEARTRAAQMEAAAKAAAVAEAEAELQRPSSGPWSPTAAGVVPDHMHVESSPEFLPEAVTSYSTFESTVIAIKVVAGLLALLALAYLGGNKRVVRFQERLGLGGAITAGFAFVGLGLFARQPWVGILTDDVLARLQPVLAFGLGWLGFSIGAQVDIRVLDRTPKGTAYLIFVETMLPFLVVALACGATMLGFGRSWNDPYVWRDVILLGAAAAMSSPQRFRGFANRAWRKGRPVEHLLGQLDELAGVIVLLFITAIFREVPGETWHLPSTAWLFMSLGIGLSVGTLIFAMVRVPVSNAEFLAVVLGGIAFASGIATYLRLSPTVVCFLAGILVTNFPNEQRGDVFKILNHLERPVRLLFLIIAGALWSVGDWRGWVLVPILVAARIAGKWLGITATRVAVAGAMPATFTQNRQLVVPLSSLSMALVIGVDALQEGRSLPWVLTAVIGGALVTELLVQRTAPTLPSGGPDDPPLELVPVDDPSASAHDLHAVPAATKLRP